MDFNEYQHRAKDTDQNPRPASDGGEISRTPKKHEVIPLLGLVGEVGGLLAEYKKILRDGATHRKFKDQVAEELGDIIWYVANTATKFDLKLDEIAQQNLEKVENRYIIPAGQRSLYDDPCPVNQQLPRRFEYRFEHQLDNGKEKLALLDQLAGGTTGDPLTDNAHEDDGYRYHDVMHLTFAALFGWSPVWRKLLRKQKRITNRTPREVDEIQDGGRAQVIDEAIVAAAYAYAADHDFLKGVDAVDWHLLRHIKRLTANLEVKDRTEGEWNNAILRGFAVWLELRTNRGGVVRGDLLAGTIEFIPPK